MKCYEVAYQGKPPIRKLAGKRFGFLTVICWAGRNEETKPVWHCKCDCGKTKNVMERHLLVGWVKSCGDNIHRQKHGCCGSQIYKTWESMLGRCCNKNNPRYHRYGARGIKVCDRWLEFQPFLDDMGERPSKHYTIERINNDGDYTPKNCRWATFHEQNRNKCTNVMITHEGRTMCLMDWAIEKKIAYHVLRARIRDYNWTIKRSLTEPVHTTRPRTREYDSTTGQSI